MICRQGRCMKYVLVCVRCITQLHVRGEHLHDMHATNYLN
jgi:hypothetical protein